MRAAVCGGTTDPTASGGPEQSAMGGMGGADGGSGQSSIGGIVGRGGAGAFGTATSGGELVASMACESTVSTAR
jgi:hypothetical protein